MMSAEVDVSYLQPNTSHVIMNKVTVISSLLVHHFMNTTSELEPYECPHQIVINALPHE